MIRARRKATTSPCRYKVVAVGFDKDGNVVAYKTNKPRFIKGGGGLHAEMELMRHYKRIIKTIIILRTNAKGDLRPIRPCSACARKAEDLGIRIVSVEGE